MEANELLFFVLLQVKVLNVLIGFWVPISMKNNAKTYFLGTTTIENISL